MSYADLDELVEKHELEARSSSITAQRLGEINAELEQAIERRKTIDKAVQERKALEEEVLRDGKVIQLFNREALTPEERQKEKENMEKDLEIRSLKTYLTGKELDKEMRAALVTTDAGAVIPKEITDRMIVDKKYSDLLHRATVFTASHKGDLSVPIANGQAANWKAELAEAADNTPAFTNMVLKAMS